MNIVFIAARGGSKGVPGKNIKHINGKPLIVWSIEQALLADCVDDVYISTDCEKIREISLEYGAKVPFLRPAEISGDTASTESAVMHFIDWAEKNNLIINNLILMQATSPFRYSRQLDKAMRQFEVERADSLVTVTKTHRFIWKNKAEPTASYDIFNRPRRQDILPKDEIYFENGSFYISNLETYKVYQNRLGGKVTMFEMSPEESFEIDDLLDFKLVEFMMQQHGIE
ncbi:acylneuraminate cytidylyltransferase family protein [Marinomonas sp. A3A]|uniref:acylneuraminate cytidylyltransferase family protein n=1 Tax=Marinomonas sp. A3A TaxID=2065312 RepID=UPI001BB45659|nr:acylneuraminate cytidylyltransferase family protein [Marinomonas sp. A3A]QUX90614.1 acylneuraminate cytidylyltransferase family protein [Marinomonas sp. A3A]